MPEMPIQLRRVLTTVVLHGPSGLKPDKATYWAWT
jgi:hypothetical protein